MSFGYYYGAEIMTDSESEYNPDNPYNKPYDKFYWELDGKSKGPPPEYFEPVKFRGKRKK